MPDLDRLLYSKRIWDDYALAAVSFYILCIPANMESAQAQFISMMVERMHALEEKVEALQQENARMTQHMAEVKNSVHLQDDLMQFSDGWSLDTQFWNPGRCQLEYGGHQYLSYAPLDASHANATAFYGQVTFFPDFSGTPLSIGQKGERTNVQQMLDGLDRWWQQYTKSASKEDIDSLIETLESCAGWEKSSIGGYTKAFTPKFQI